jgi:hypothetical protein
MNRLLSILALAALAGCGADKAAERGTNGAGASNGSATNAGADAKPGMASADQEAQAEVVRRPGPEMVQTRLVGAWSRDKDCGRKLAFSEGGTLVAFDGTSGSWSVTGPSADGTMIRMEGPGRVANMEVTLIAQDEVHLRDTDPGAGGKTLYMQRCAG